MCTTSIDVVDEILGDARTDRVIALRAQKPELAEQMQSYYDAVFCPNADSADAFSPEDRLLVAIRAASTTGSTAVADWYVDQAQRAGVSMNDLERAKRVEEPWPGEDRLGSVMRHVDLVTRRPVESSRADIDALLAAGFSPAGIVVISQVIAYVSYQLRLVAAFRALGTS